MRELIRSTLGRRWLAIGTESLGVSLFIGVIAVSIVIKERLLAVNSRGRRLPVGGGRIENPSGPQEGGPTTAGGGLTKPLWEH